MNKNKDSTLSSFDVNGRSQTSQNTVTYFGRVPNASILLQFFFIIKIH